MSFIALFIIVTNNESSPNNDISNPFRVVQSDNDLIDHRVHLNKDQGGLMQLCRLETLVPHLFI